MNLKQLHDALSQFSRLYGDRDNLDMLLSPAGVGIGTTGRDKQPTREEYMAKLARVNADIAALESPRLSRER